ncbi:predicted protein [Chaetoceros tenuissimus]|uniref:Uncharacterized protein n=1 Tax=Chaetoceros tenuissimus TaxID=426638 RepID=A0AAD3H261_9STRA|nr:predicted protein [Chaetoceros tenuissimus]
MEFIKTKKQHISQIKKVFIGLAAFACMIYATFERAQQSRYIQDEVQKITRKFDFKRAVSSTQYLEDEDMNITSPTEFHLSENHTFTFPEDPAATTLRASHVTYLREYKEILHRGSSGEECASMPKVFQWILQQLHESEEKYPLFIAYGEMIHLLREGDFIHKNGSYIDDDLDTWAIPETVVFLANLEHLLFEKFGWTMRLFSPDTDVINFVQIMESCGHRPRNAATKVTDTKEPAIELYPLVPAKGDDSLLVDSWQGTKIDKDLVFPAQDYVFESKALDKPITVKLAQKYDEILKCLYGNWTVPSSKHADIGSVCISEREVASEE